MADEQKSESADPQPTGQNDEVHAEAGEGYTISAQRVTWMRIHLLVLLAAATATLAILLAGDPADRPLWLILLVVALVLLCLLATYALSKAIARPARQPLRADH